jgi:sulfonate transport system substrate-binding protein
MNFRNISNMVLFISLALSINAYSAEPLRIGYQKSSTTLVLLKGEGALEKALTPLGVQVQWTEFPGGPQLLEGLNVGSIDFGFAGETPPVFAQAAGAALVYVANEPASPTAESILVAKDSPIKTLADLKGKKIALNKGSNVHYLLVQALKNAGLSYQDITPVYLTPADARAAFERGSVDAWVIWDPFSAAAEKQLQARVLRDGQGLVNNYQFYLATRNYANQHPQVLNQLIEQIHQIDTKSTQDPTSVTQRIAPLLGLSEEITRIAVERQKYNAAFITPDVATSQQQIADTFADLHLIPAHIKIQDALWTPPTVK